MEEINFKYDFHKNYKLKIKEKIYLEKGLCGLTNIGNSCYMNSIFQCLSSSLLLTDYILSTQYKDDLSSKQKNEHFVLQSYIMLLNNIWETNQVLRPKSFFENMAKFHRKYFSLKQQDSHECLMYILEILHNALSYPIEIDIKGTVLTKYDLLYKQYLETWKIFYEKEYSFIIETFYGGLINNITCKSCEFTENVFEPFNSLSLSINEDDNLESVLKNYFDHQENINSWKCEKCTGNGCRKKTSIWEIPKYLIIHLKRFKKELGGQTLKNNSLIKFPLKNLNLNEYMSSDIIPTQNYIYDCYSINYHSGNLESGHYTSACKNLNNNWYNFNDANVMKYNSTNLESQLITKDAYILFYHRKFINNKPIQL